MDDINRYFEILGLKPGASLDEVKEAYKDLVKVWHPDRFAHDPKLQQKAQEKLKEINEAYQKIQDFLNNLYKYQQATGTNKNEFDATKESAKTETKQSSETNWGEDNNYSQPPPFEQSDGKQNKTPSLMRDPSSLTKWVKIFLYASIVIEIIALFSGILQYQLLSDFKQGVYTSIPLATAAAEANDKRQQIIRVFNISFFIITAILFLRWIHRANYNVRQLGAKNMKFTPGWAIGWYFIPIALLWKPYQAMKEIWKASKNPDDWQAQSGSPILPWWWFFYISFSYLGITSFNHALRAKELNELIEATTFWIAYNIFCIPFIILTIVLVSRIYEMQTSHYKGVITENVSKKSRNIAAWIFGIIGLCIVAAIVIPYYVGVQERARNAQNEEVPAPEQTVSYDEWVSSRKNTQTPAPPPTPAPYGYDMVQGKGWVPTPAKSSENPTPTYSYSRQEDYNSSKTTTPSNGYNKTGNDSTSKSKATFKVEVVPVKRLTAAEYDAQNKKNFTALVIKDQVTGLMWTKDANLANAIVDLPSAIDFILRLNKEAYAGYSDWRLPTANELVNLSKHVHELSFSNLQRNYISSTKISENKVIIVDVPAGDQILDTNKVQPNYILPVRN